MALLNYIAASIGMIAAFTDLKPSADRRYAIRQIYGVHPGTFIEMVRHDLQELKAWGLFVAAACNFGLSILAADASAGSLAVTSTVSACCLIASLRRTG